MSTLTAPTITATHVRALVRWTEGVAVQDAAGKVHVWPALTPAQADDPDLVVVCTHDVLARIGAENHMAEQCSVSCSARQSIFMDPWMFVHG